MDGLFENLMNKDFYKILDEYPEITPDQVEMFTEIYYPIATLDIDMEEKTFENFEIIQSTILRLFKCGASDPSEIADIILLDSNYVQSVTELLIGYGLLSYESSDSSKLKITDLGNESLSEGKKLKSFNTKQRFQADALTGDLLLLEKQTSEKYLKNVKRLNNKIPIVRALEGISSDSIVQTFEHANLCDYKKHNKDVLKANVDAIKSIDFVSLDYIEAYMFKLRDCQASIIMTYQHNTAPSEKNKDRFIWKPMMVTDESVRWKYGFSESMQTYSNGSIETINRLSDLIRGRSPKSVDVLNERIADSLYGFNNFSSNFRSSSPLNGVVNFNSASFVYWDYFLFDLLSHLDVSVYPSVFYYVNPKISDFVLHFETTDQEVIQYARFWQSLIQKYSRTDINEVVIKYLMGLDIDFGFCQLEEAGEKLKEDTAPIAQ